MAPIHTLTDNVKIAHSIAPQNVAGGVNGDGVDCWKYEGAVCNVYIGTLTAGQGVAVHVEESADNVTFADVTSATTGNLIDGVADKLHKQIDINLSERLRYLRAVAAVASGSGGLMSADFILYKGRYLPPTQEMTAVIV